MAIKGKENCSNCVNLPFQDIYGLFGKKIMGRFLRLLASTRHRKTILFKAILTLNVLVALLLLISNMASYISPALAWTLALFGIGYPYLLMLNLLFVVYWIMLREKAFLISLAVILFGFPNLRNQIQFNFFQKKEVPETVSFKVISFNTRLFDLYKWTQNSQTRSRIFKLLRTEQPGIICLQEFYTSQRPGLNNLDTLLALPQIKNHHVAYTETLRETNHWGIGTFTSYPVVKKGKILFHEKTNNICIFTDIKIGSDTIRVYNVHFQSNRLKKEDYEFLDDPGRKEREAKLEASKKILARLKTGSIKRSGQVDVVASHIQQSPYPVIVCGDFNDPPSSYTYKRISNNLRDAFVESGSGVGNTYNGLIPLLRIDYILHDKSFRSSQFRTIRKNLSDHFPVLCRISIPARETSDKGLDIKR